MTSTGSVEASSSLRRSLELAFLRLVRSYTYNTPFKKGTFRMFTLAMAVCKHPHTGLLVPAIDGRRFSVDLTTGMEETVFFHGRYEPFLTEVSKKLIRPGDVCIDAGANFGWYTTLFAELVGTSGEVHAFEPVGRMFEQLRINLSLLKNGDHVFINRTALGEKAGTVVINMFDGDSTGRASISSQGRSDVRAIECEMTTLDAYLEMNAVPDVDFVKLDIEGGEMMFIHGAGRLFEQAKAPVFLIEMSTDLSAHLGYHPNDLIELMRSRAEYEFYAADEKRNKLSRIDGFEPGDIGANVFCIPRTREERRMAIAEFIEA